MVVSRKLYEHSCPHCSTTSHPVAEATLPPEFLKLLSSETLKLIEAAFNKKQYSGVLSIIGKLLTNQVHDNYKTITADWKTPDIEMLHRLTRDVWSFSAAKDYQQMRDLTLALSDEAGKLREFVAFKEAAMKVCTKYNETWLQTEYNQAVAASQNAARWTQFTADKADIPFLEYQTVGDDAVRASHALLDGIVRKVDDSFWSTHYPPNGWGCRCEVIQAVGAKTPKKDIPNVGIPEMFRTNLAQTGLIYPKNHPYYTGIPKAEIRKAIAYLPPENTFVTYAYKPEVSIHPLHGNGEVEGNLRVIEAFINNFSGGKNPITAIDLLPELNQNDSKIKSKFYPKGFKMVDNRKHADAIITFKNKDKWVVDFKYMDGEKGTKLAKRIKDASLKSNYAIIMFKNNVELTKRQIINTMNEEKRQHKELKGIIIMDKNKNVIWSIID